MSQENLELVRSINRRWNADESTRDLIDPFWTDAGFLLALERFGYDVTDTQKAVIAFQKARTLNWVFGELR